MKILADLITILTPVLIAIATIIAAKLGDRFIKEKEKRAAYDRITEAGIRAVAITGQGFVADAKDPTKPNQWDDIAKKEAKALSVKIATETSAAAAKVLIDLGITASAVQQEISGAIEVAVLDAQKPATVTVAPPTPGAPPTPMPAVIVPAVPDAPPRERGYAK